MPERVAPRAVPRRTCPACARRYAGLIAPDCLLCRGLGVLSLGAAALHHHQPAAVARAVELYLEHQAQAAMRLPLVERRPALEAAVDELRLAGVLASTADAAGQPAHSPAPRDTAAARVVELDALRLTRDLGAPATARVAAALAAPAVALHIARPRDGSLPTASANGHRAALATIADPIDPLGPDTGALEHERGAANHDGRVLAGAVAELAARRRRTHRKG